MKNMDGNFSVWFRAKKILNRSECIFTDEEAGNRKVSCFLNLCPPFWSRHEFVCFLHRKIMTSENETVIIKIDFISVKR